VKGLGTGVVLAVFFVLQTLFCDALTFGKIGPDFPLLIVAYFAIFRGAIAGSIFGFVVGLFQDLFNPSFLGLNALTKTLVGFALGRAGAQTERDHPVFLLALFGLSALAHDFVYLLFFTQFRLGHFFVTLLTVSLPSALYTAVVGLAVHVGVAFFLTEVVRNLGKTRS
jgi:rod shape-determining protein MreD